MRWLKQSTAVNVVVGPLVDESDGVTPLTSVTLGDITAAVIKGVSRTGITLTASGTHHFTHVGDGYWELNLASGDTDTLGLFRVTVRDDDGFLPVWEDFAVLPANVYDSLVAGSDRLEVDAAETSGTAAAEIADAVLDESTAGHQTSGTLGAEIHLSKAMLANKRVHIVSTGVDTVMDDDGVTPVRVMTPVDGGDDTIEVEPS